MHEPGAIKVPYAAHDFRHCYAATEYQANPDIYRISKLLDHANIAVTETYL